MDEFKTQQDSGVNKSVPEIIAGNLRIENVLGRGGMGTVYKATHLSLDREVAVKIINHEFVSNTDINQRFAREAKMMAKLRHPRAAVIYDSGSLPDGRLFIVMEYVEGETLGDVLKREGKLPARRAVEIATSICEVLSEAHALGIIHRDLKPANIMLNRRGIFVLDFGIAKMLNTDNRESLNLSMTGTGLLVGTPYYMSPEQCLGETVGAQSDLYSLGALLYEMLAGRPPFDDDVLSAIIIKHATAEPPPIEQFAPDIPPALAAAIRKMLAKKPEDRPADAEQARALLIDSLNSQTANKAAITQSLLVAEAGTQAGNNITETIRPQASFAFSLPESNRGKGRGRAALIGFALLLLVGAAIGGGIWTIRQKGAETTANSSNAANPANVSVNTNQDMTHMQHNMPMGDDFAMKTADDKSGAPSAPLLSEEEADAVITRITQTTEHRADGMQIIKTPKDTALVCIHNMIEMGKTHMFAVERPNVNSPWEITARVSLDNNDFHGSNWTFEPQDVDGDGYEDVIFNGSTADKTQRRCLIYVPRTRQNYSLTVTKDANGKIINSILSPNAQSANVKAFRDALEQNVQTR